MKNNRIKKWVFLPFIIIVFVFLLQFANNARLNTLSKKAGWGWGKMSASERGYYQYRLRAIGDKWRKTFVDHGYNRDGLAKEGYESVLVIDTLNSAMWVETKGKIASQDYCELPANMKWKIYRTTNGKNEDLPKVLKLKMRGIWTGQEYPEMYCFHGIGRSKDSFSIYVTSGDIFTDYGGSGYTVQNWKKPATPINAENYFEPLIVSDAEWLEYQNKYGTAVLAQDSDKDNQNQEAKFYDSLKKICQYIEIETARHGHKLDYLHRYEIASNYNAIKGEMSLDDDGNSIIPIKRRRIHEDNLFRAQLLGENLWYVQTFPEEKNGQIQPNDEVLNFAFVMRDGKILSEADFKKLSDEVKGRFVIEAPTNPDWMQKMDNGAEVELLGICYQPSLGGKWWGPDGKYLEYEPYYGSESGDKSTKDDIFYDVAFRIHWPSRTSNSVTSISSITPGSSGDTGMSSGGNHPVSQIFLLKVQANKQLFELDVKVDIGLQKQKPQSLVFRSIPLIPDNSKNFKITIE